MSTQNRPNHVVDTKHPRNACDVASCMPHENATQGPARRHRSDVVACQCLDAASCVGDQPQLRHYCNCAQEKAGHP